MFWSIMSSIQSEGILTARLLEFIVDNKLCILKSGLQNKTCAKEWYLSFQVTLKDQDFICGYSIP